VTSRFEASAGHPILIRLVSDHFDRWAPSYERDRRSRWLGRLQRGVLALLELGPGDVLCDVGYGSGRR
jgi:hypothetical protein